MDPRKNFAYGIVGTAPTPATSGTSLVLSTGHGARFPDTATDGPFNVIVWPTGVAPLADNAEIIRVNTRSSNSFSSITRQQEGSAARAIVPGDQVALGVTAKWFDDVVTTGVIDAYRDFGVRADGTDQATKLQKALDAARDFGSKLILPGHAPSQAIVSAGQLLFDSNVMIEGAGQGPTILKQADNSNLNGFLKTRNYDSLVGGSSNGGETRFEIKNIILDGNKANNTVTGTDGLQIFGYRYKVSDIAIRNFRGKPVDAEWGTPGSPTTGEPGALGGLTGPMEAWWEGVRCYFNIEGFKFNGPNDAVLRSVFCSENAFNAQGPSPAVLPNLWIGSKSLACLLESSHVYDGGNYGMQFDASVLALNCTAEGSQDANVYVNVPSVRWVGGHIFSAAGMINSTTKIGVKFNANGSIFMFGASMSECIDGFFDFTTGGGSGSDIDAFLFGSGAWPLYLGSPSQQNTYNLRGAINNENPANLLPSGARRAVRTDTRTDFGSIGEDEDFLNNILTSGSIGRLGWTTFFSAAGSVSATAAAFGHPGVIRIATGATAGVAALGLSNSATAGCVVNNNEHDTTYIIKPPANNATTVRVGLQTDPSANPSTDGVYFEKLSTDTNWFAVCRAGGVQTRVDTGVAAVNFGWTRLRIRWVFTTVLHFYFSIGGSQVADISSNLPANSTPLSPVFQLINTTNVNQVMDIDYFGLRVVNLNR